MRQALSLEARQLLGADLVDRFRPADRRDRRRAGARTRAAHRAHGQFPEHGDRRGQAAAARVGEGGVRRLSAAGQAAHRGRAQRARRVRRRRAGAGHAVGRRATAAGAGRGRGRAGRARRRELHRDPGHHARARSRRQLRELRAARDDPPGRSRGHPPGAAREPGDLPPAGGGRAAGGVRLRGLGQGTARARLAHRIDRGRSPGAAQHAGSRRAVPRAGRTAVGADRGGRDRAGLAPLRRTPPGRLRGDARAGHRAARTADGARSRTALDRAGRRGDRRRARLGGALRPGAGGGAADPAAAAAARRVARAAGDRARAWCC